MMLSPMEHMECAKQSDNHTLESDQCVSTTTRSHESPKNLESTNHLEKDSVLNNDKMLPPCKVCGDKSSGFHYGVISCEACKSFFRRSFRRKRKLICFIGRGLCDAKLCSYCRQKKCILAGMSKKAIKIGRYTHEQKTQHTLEFKGELIKDESNLERLTDDSMTNSHKTHVDEICENINEISVHSLKIDDTEDDVAECARVKFDQMIERLTDASERLNPYGAITQSQDVLERKQTDYYEFCSLMNDIFGNLFGLSREEHDAFYETTGIDLGGRNQKTALELDDACRLATSMIDFAKVIPGFREIDLADQISLLKESFCEYWLICSIKYVHKDYLVKASPTGRLYSWREVSFLLSMEFQREGKLFFQAASKLLLSTETWAIIKAMTLTFPDRTTMKKREQVEHVQCTLIDCLQYSLSQRHERPQEILSKIIDLFLLMRNATELARESYLCNIIRWPNIKQYPLIYELLSMPVD